MSKDEALFILQLIGGSKDGGAKGIPKVPKNYVPKNIKMINDKYLKKQGSDAHELKTDFIGRKNIAHYDIYVDKDTGMLWIYRKGGKEEGIPTYEYIK